jgi:hypothetical protein
MVSDNIWLYAFAAKEEERQALFIVSSMSISFDQGLT